MTFIRNRFAKGALASALALSLVAGTSPTTLAFAANATHLTNKNTAQTDSSATQNKTTDSTTQTDPSASSATQTDPAATQTQEEAESEDDPYASTYVVNNADAGQSTGSLSYVIGDSAAQAAAEQATSSWESADTIVLVPDTANAEVLCAAALAGALDCPVLFIGDGTVDEATADAISALGTTRAIVIAERTCNVKDACAVLSAIGTGDGSEVPQLSEIVTLQGYDATETSLDVALYGQANNLWNKAGITIANGSDCETARATTGFAYRMAQPVLLTTASGDLSAPERLYFSRARDTFSSSRTTFAILATSGSVSNAEESLLLLSADATGKNRVVSLEGENAYDVNYHAESWYASRHSDIAWNNSVIANPAQSSCATAGIMAAKLGVAHLACAPDALSTSVGIPASTGATSLILSGEGGVFEKWVVNGLRACTGIIEVETASAGIAIDDAANREVDNSMGSDGKPTKAKDDILEAMDPSRASFGTAGFYEFALLDEGYSGAVTAEQIDAFIDEIAGSYEGSYGAASLLRDQGQAFIDAAKESGVNEVYLLAHAILESACGCSPLARGTVSGANNFFGISAFDSNPDAGASYAAAQGWNSPETGIKGGGAWIAENYLHAGQNTIYLMRFNLPSGGHQYATSLTWPMSIAKLMDRFYTSAGIDLAHTGLRFKVTTY